METKNNWSWFFNFAFWVILIIGTAQTDMIDLQIKVVLFALGFLGIQLNNQLN